MAVDSVQLRSTKHSLRAVLISGIRKTVLHVAVIVLSYAFFLPLLFMVSSSLKPQWQIFQLPPQWIPRPPVWGNYPEALTFVPFARYFSNTMFIAVPVVFGIVLSSAVVAYGFARLHWPGRDVLFLIMMSTIMIPDAVRQIPMFVVYHRLGWIGTFKPLIIPAFFAGPRAVFLIRQFMRTIPDDMTEAAHIDGANHLQIFLRLMLPLIRPPLALIALWNFMGVWNDYYRPLIYLQKPELQTMAIGLTSFLGEHQERWDLLMAASTMTIAPIIVLFFLTQRTFIEGITFTGQKG